MWHSDFVIPSGITVIPSGITVILSGITVIPSGITVILSGITVILSNAKNLATVKGYFARALRPAQHGAPFGSQLKF